MTVRWEEIIGKPTAFPPAAHTHHPDDLQGARASDYAARGAGAGYQMGLARLDASAAAIVVPDGGAVTPLYDLTYNLLQHLFVCGRCDPDIFYDEVITCQGSAFGILTAHSRDLLGAPGARTYSLSAGAIRVAIAGAGAKNYDVKFATLTFPA